jgi:hypothetical protein
VQTIGNKKIKQKLGKCSKNKLIPRLGSQKPQKNGKPIEKNLNLELRAGPTAGIGNLPRGESTTSASIHIGVLDIGVPPRPHASIRSIPECCAAHFLKCTSSLDNLGPKHCRGRGEHH